MQLLISTFRLSTLSTDYFLSFIMNITSSVLPIQCASSEVFNRLFPCSVSLFQSYVSSLSWVDASCSHHACSVSAQHSLLEIGGPSCSGLNYSTKSAGPSYRYCYNFCGLPDAGEESWGFCVLGETTKSLGCSGKACGKSNNYRTLTWYVIKMH